MNKGDFYSLLRTVPKSEIHIHQEAVLSSKTIRKVYKRSYGRAMTKTEYDSLFAYETFQGFLDSFIKIQSFFTNINDLEFLFQDFAHYLEKNNIVYCETFFSPTSHLRKGWDFNQMLTLVSKSLTRIRNESGRTVKLIVDVSRSFGEENAMRNLDFVLSLNNPDIIGIGLGGNEETGPARTFEKVFKKAIKHGLHVVAHAGEICPSTSVWDSLKYLKIERIGHGITTAYDEKLLKKVVDEQVPLEVCPTSNVFTKKVISDIRQHPVRKLFDSGALVTINTDDPTFFKVSLIDEYWNLYKYLNFSLDEIKQLIKNGFKSLFIPESKKKAFCTQVEKAWKQWMTEHDNQ